MLKLKNTGHVLLLQGRTKLLVEWKNDFIHHLNINYPSWTKHVLSAKLTEFNIHVPFLSPTSVCLSEEREREFTLYFLTSIVSKPYRICLLRVVKKMQLPTIATISTFYSSIHIWYDLVTLALNQSLTTLLLHLSPKHPKVLHD